MIFTLVPVFTTIRSFCAGDCERRFPAAPQFVAAAVFLGSATGIFQLPCYKTLFTKGFQQVIYRMGFKGFYGKLIKSGSKYYCRRLLYQFQHFKAIYFRHLHIQEYQVGLVLLYGFEAFKAIAAFLYHFNLRESLASIPLQPCVLKVHHQ
jgi:hypothetical protein